MSVGDGILEFLVQHRLVVGFNSADMLLFCDKLRWRCRFGK